VAVWLTVDGRWIQDAATGRKYPAAEPILNTWFFTAVSNEDLWRKKYWFHTEEGVWA
jgi:hypothetical protein